MRGARSLPHLVQWDTNTVYDQTLHVTFPKQIRMGISMGISDIYDVI